MKKKIILAMALLAAVVLVSSCGKKKEQESQEKETYTLKPETTSVKGDLGDYFEVVDKDYTTTNDYGSCKLTVEIKRTDKEFPFDLEKTAPVGSYGADIDKNAGFGIEILDENGTVIDKKAPDHMYDSDDMAEALKLRPGETSTIQFSFMLRNEDKPASFRILSTITDAPEISESSSSSSESSFDNSYSSESSSAVGDDDDDDDDDDEVASSSSSREDWNSILASYERYVDKYIALAKKAKNGNTAALSELAGLLSEAQDLQNKLDRAKSDLTAAQVARLNKINSKLAKAAL